MEELTYDTKLSILDGVVEYNITTYNAMRKFLIDYIDEQVIDLINKGHTFKLDFKQRSIKIGNKSFDLLIDKPKISQVEYIEKLNELYHSYKYSRPTERSDKRKRYIKFKAINANDLSIEDLVSGEDREVARYKLETYVVKGYYSGLLQFDGWFYQGKDKDFIIIKSWFN